MNILSDWGMPTGYGLSCKSTDKETVDNPSWPRDNTVVNMMGWPRSSQPTRHSTYQRQWTFRRSTSQPRRTVTNTSAKGISATPSLSSASVFKEILGPRPENSCREIEQQQTSVKVYHKCKKLCARERVVRFARSVDIPCRRSAKQKPANE